MLANPGKGFWNFQTMVGDFMGLPKNLTPKLIKELNDACKAFSAVCNCECDDVGWCDTCWVIAGGGTLLDLPMDIQIGGEQNEEG